MSRRGDPRQRRLRHEALEDRRMLANVMVGNLNDVVNGTVTSIAALVATPGADGISLREAILAANADNTDASDTINFAPSVAGDIQLTNVGHAGELAITSNLTINGPGAGLLTIRGFAGTAAVRDGARIFNVDDGAATFKDVLISGLTLSGGDVNSAGGAILNVSENLSLASCTISGNTSLTGGAFRNNGGNVSVSGSTISGNTTLSNGAGIESLGGSLNVSASTISGNSITAGGFGGGVSSASSTVTIDSSTISDNYANIGGGVYHGGGAAATMTITGSTISTNRARTNGGGVFGNGNVVVRHSTIANNQADSDGNASGNGGGVFVLSATTTIDHTIVAGNRRGAGSTRDDMSGPIAARFSLIGDNTGATITDNGSNQIGTGAAPINATLGPLIVSGGLTATHTLLPFSPAIDAGDPGFSPPPTSDQRGAPFVRVFDGNGVGGARIDIGAYERQALPSAEIVVDTFADEDDGNYSAGDLSLREAINLTNGSTGAHIVRFHAQLTSGGRATLPLTMGTLTVRTSLTISGPGANRLTIDAPGAAGSTFVFADGDDQSLANAVFSGLTLTGARGAIASTENLVIADAVIDDSDGVGIFSSAGSLNPNSLVIRDSTVSGHADAGVSKRYGVLTIERSTIDGNRGGVYALDAAVTIRDATISRNSARAGAGLFLDGGTVVVENSTISGNLSRHTEAFGGGIRITDGNLVLRHSTITGNTARGFSIYSLLYEKRGRADGGGISISNSAVSLENTIVAGNAVEEEDAPTTADAPDISGAIAASFSLVGNTAGAVITNNGGNLFNAPANLAPLAANDGPTMTHALLAGSPAIDAGDPTAVAGAGSVPLFDQRGSGFSRVLNGRLDIGALEQAAASGDFDVDLDVDGFDFLAWQRAFGATSVAATRANGNADGDLDVDGDDLSVWRTQFGATPSAAAAMANSVIAPQHPSLTLPIKGRGSEESIARAADAVYASLNLSGSLDTPERPVRWKSRFWRR